LRAHDTAHLRADVERERLELADLCQDERIDARVVVSRLSEVDDRRVLQCDSAEQALAALDWRARRRRLGRSGRVAAGAGESAGAVAGAGAGETVAGGGGEAAGGVARRR
jgi:hypothetical protein